MGANVYRDPIEQFKEAMLDSGVNPPNEIIPDGALHRFKIDGKLNGAYVFHLTGRRPAGYFQDFKQGIEQNWKQSGDFKPLTDSERQVFAIECQRLEEKRQAELQIRHDRAARRAVAIWRAAKPAPEDHPYLSRKNVKPHGPKLGYGNTLIIPLYKLKP
jgi:putative DNA primase/helicase